MTGRFVKLEYLVGKGRSSIWERKDSGLYRWMMIHGSEDAQLMHSEPFFKALDRLYEKYINEMMLLDQA